MSLNLIMLGPPGAGKGTQAERLAREQGIPRISTGDILRDAVSEGTELGAVARRAIDAGQLVSDDVMIGIVRERLSRPDVARGFVLDGFPRTVCQAQALDGLMAGRDPLLVIEIQVPVEQLVRRTARRRVCSRCGLTTSMDGSATCARCGGELVSRSDDGEAVVRARMEVYERQTRPLVEYYRNRPTFRVVNGNQAPDAVAADLRAAVVAARTAARTPPRAAADEAAGHL
ncbi:MAG TPA: adenylate kinase [Vicinamibacterales bacterium]|nr:adenylate kinase [Vicinamibacterales bacterium]